MGRYVHADADPRASGRTRLHRRAADLLFLARVIELRAAGDVKTLGAMLREPANATDWRQVALKRAIKTAVMAAPSRTEEP